MIEHVVALLEQQEDLTRLDSIDIRYIDSIFISSSQIIAVASEFKDEKKLLQTWNRAARQFAYRIQNNIPTEFDDLRWDMYLIFCVKQPNLDALVCKQIENNRFYFRKIVLSESNLGNLQEHLPLPFKNDFYDQEMTLFFEDHVFFQKLKEVLTEEVGESVVPDNFFQRGFRTTEELKQLLNDVVSEGGKP